MAQRGEKSTYMFYIIIDWQRRKNVFLPAKDSGKGPFNVSNSTINQLPSLLEIIKSQPWSSMQLNRMQWKACYITRLQWRLFSIPSLRTLWVAIFLWAGLAFFFFFCQSACRLPRSSQQSNINDTVTQSGISLLIGRRSSSSYVRSHSPLFSALVWFEN